MGQLHGRGPKRRDTGPAALGIAAEIDQNVDAVLVDPAGTIQIAYRREIDKAIRALLDALANFAAIVGPDAVREHLEPVSIVHPKQRIRQIGVEVFPVVGRQVPDSYPAFVAPMWEANVDFCNRVRIALADDVRDAIRHILRHGYSQRVVGERKIDVPRTLVRAITHQLDNAAHVKMAHRPVAMHEPVVTAVEEDQTWIEAALQRRIGRRYGIDVCLYCPRTNSFCSIECPLRFLEPTKVRQREPSFYDSLGVPWIKSNCLVAGDQSFFAASEAEQRLRQIEPRVCGIRLQRDKSAVVVDRRFEPSEHR